MSNDRYPEEEMSEWAIVGGHAFLGLLLFVLVVVQVAAYDVVWYYWVPLCLVLIARPFAYHQIGYSDGHAAGRKHHERISLYESLGDFQVGDELQAFRRKHRELSSLYEHSRYVLDQKCKAYDEACAWKQNFGKSIEDEKIWRNNNAWEELGDAVEKCDEYKKALDKLAPEMEKLEWKERIAISQTVKETTDAEFDMMDEGGKMEIV